MSADPVQALVEKWLVESKNCDPAIGMSLEMCADELEAALQAFPLPCPHGENCPCAVNTQHNWFIAFCEERDKLRALPSEPSDDQLFQRASLIFLERHIQGVVYGSGGAHRDDWCVGGPNHGADTCKHPDCVLIRREKD